MRKLCAVQIALSLMLTGCSASGSVWNSTNGSPAESKVANQWLRACEKYEFSEEVGFSKAYQEVIVDVCAKADPKARQDPYIASPNVNPENLAIYLNAERFSESYWQNYMNGDFPKKNRVIFTELDESWWVDQMTEKVKNPQLSWFTSKNEGGHCRVEAEIYCPKLFRPSETITNEPIEFRIIGTKLNWQDWQLLNSAHEMVHLYQDSHGMSHWATWYIEGQATFFELAMAELLYKSDHIRRDYLFTRPAREDKYVFLPTSSSSVLYFLRKCEVARNGECDSFKYGGGSVFHEKLVIDFGLPKYFEWQRFLIDNMPKGNPADLSQPKKDSAARIFDQSFSVVFHIAREKWEKTILAPYLFEIFG